ncbi:MAG: hypothetical protein GF418_08015, partial [Chitinivibrionales bacterium]|nr:hypothetical protein [Chitinivibrionales bacterium]MBD3395558.1 hypothetical protein [Chitinivibrionales bacterium]
MDRKAKKNQIISVLTAIIVLGLARAGFAQPAPGDVFKELKWDCRNLGWVS